MTLNQTEVSAAAGFIISNGDGKSAVVADGHRMVRIPEKKIGKGKGKTVAYVVIPFIPAPIAPEDITLCLPMLNDVLEELQKDIIVRMQRDGSKAVTPSDISIEKCAQEYANRKFSAESVGFWFDNEMAEYLAVLIATAKGWNVEELAQEQQTYIEQKQTAYRASYCETAARFPKLDPVQVTELLRVLDLTEATGAVPAAIREAIKPRTSAQALGF